MDKNLKLSPSDFVALANQTLEYAFSGVLVEGEVSSYKVNQGKYVFFDLKDETASVSCFMMLFNLRFPIQDGMKLIIRAVPKLTAWGKFSLTVFDMQPVGDGDIKKSADLLKAKLAKEGLFDVSRKRPLPSLINKIALISSTDAAGYQDFIKILNERWGGIEVDVAHVQVQGMGSSDQIIRAIKYFNQFHGYDVIAIIRGGGSQQDLATFNDELLVRKIAASKILVITGIGHEIDESLSDLVADVRASTPSNAATILTRDKTAEISKIKNDISRLSQLLQEHIISEQQNIKSNILDLSQIITNQICQISHQISEKRLILESLNPANILKRGYAIIEGDIKPNNVVKITTYSHLIQAEVKNVAKRH